VYGFRAVRACTMPSHDLSHPSSLTPGLRLAPRINCIVARNAKRIHLACFYPPQFGGHNLVACQLSLNRARRVVILFGTEMAMECTQTAPPVEVGSGMSASIEAGQV